jgi:hypothetical protein
MRAVRSYKDDAVTPVKKKKKKQRPKSATLPGRFSSENGIYVGSENETGNDSNVILSSTLLTKKTTRDDVSEKENSGMLEQETSAMVIQNAARRKEATKRVAIMRDANLAEDDTGDTFAMESSDLGDESAPPPTSQSPDGMIVMEEKGLGDELTHVEESARENSLENSDEEKSALAIQNAVRCREAKKITNEKRKVQRQQETSAMVIQNAARRKEATKRVAIMRDANLAVDDTGGTFAMESSDLGDQSASPTESPTELHKESSGESPSESQVESPIEDPTGSPIEGATEPQTESASDAAAESPTDSPTEDGTEPTKESPTESPMENENPTELSIEGAAEPQMEIATEEKSAIVIQAAARRKEAGKLVEEKRNSRNSKFETEMGSEDAAALKRQAESNAATLKIQSRVRTNAAQREYEAFIRLHRKMREKLAESNMLIALPGTMQGSTGWWAHAF